MWKLGRLFRARCSHATRGSCPVVLYLAVARERPCAVTNVMMNQRTLVKKTPDIDVLAAARRARSGWQRNGYRDREAGPDQLRRTVIK